MSLSAVVGNEFRTSTVNVVESSSLVTWVDELLTMAPGAGQAAIKLALRASFREFCVRSGAWTREIGKISLTAGVADYEVPEQDDSEVLYLLAMMWRPYAIPPDDISGDPGTFTEHAEFIPSQQGPHYQRALGAWTRKPMGFVGQPEVPRSFSVFPTPSENVQDVITMYCVLGPKDPYADTVPKVFLVYHFDAILEGAASKLLSQQNKPYTNLVMSRYYSQRFNAKIVSARDMARRQFTSAPSAWQYPRWA